MLFMEEGFQTTFPGSAVLCIQVTGELPCSERASEGCADTSPGARASCLPFTKAEEKAMQMKLALSGCTGLFSYQAALVGSWAECQEADEFSPLAGTDAFCDHWQAN